MYNFNLVVGFGENIDHNQRCALIQMNLYFGVYIPAEIAFIKYGINVI